MSLPRGFRPAISLGGVGSTRTPVNTIWNSDGTDRLLRPVTDTTTTHIIATDGTQYLVK